MAEQRVELSRRDELLTKAAELFRKRGYHATSMEDIANALGILRGSLYHHISSKQDLLSEIMTRGIEVLLEHIRPVAANRELAPEERLVGIIRAHVLTVTEQPDVVAVFLHEHKSLGHDHIPRLLMLRDEYEGLVREVIQEGIQAGVFRPVDVRVATFGLLGMVNWLYQWYRPGGRCGPEEIADQFAEMALQSLKV
jgi:AcrR family transcriptional regulator